MEKIEMRIELREDAMLHVSIHTTEDNGDITYHELLKVDAWHSSIRLEGIKLPGEKFGNIQIDKPALFCLTMDGTRQNPDEVAKRMFSKIRDGFVKKD